MAANNFPVVLNGAPVDADLWFNPIAEAVTALQTQVAGLQTKSLLVSKTADESVTSSITRQSDDHLFVPVAANKRYAVTLFLIVSGVAGTSATESGIGLDWTFPGLATMYHGDIGPAPGINGGVSTTAFGNWVAYQSVASPSNAISHGTATTNFVLVSVLATLATGANAGTLQLRWGQENSNGTPTTVKTGSWLRLDEMN